MKSPPWLILLPLLLLNSINGLSQNNSYSAVICGKILFEKDSILPFRSYSIILQKDWPITFQEFEQVDIDTSDYSFKIRMDLDQITYGNIIVNFFPDIDSTAFAKSGHYWLAEMPDGFYKNQYAVRIRFSGLRFVVEPGDSIHLVVDYEKIDPYHKASASFSGSGGANNNFLRSRDLLQGNYNNSFKLPLDEGLSAADSKMEDDLQTLNKAKDTLSDGYYELLKTDILFQNLRMKHALIRASLYGPEPGVEEKRAIARIYYSYLDTLTLRSEYLKSTVFRSYLSSHLEYLNRIITGKDIQYNYDENSYWLANGVFEEEILKAFLYERLAFQMETHYFLNKKKFQYTEFVERFPGTPETYRLEKLFKKHFPVSNGQRAPDLVMVDSTGRKKNLSDLRGKVIILSSAQAWMNITQYEQKTERIESLRKRFGKDLVMIAFDLKYREGRPLSNYIDYYVSEDLSSQNYSSYIFSSSNRYIFLIRKNGIINDCVRDLYISEKTISELISEKYTLLTRLKSAAERHTLEIVIFLSVVISLVLILLLNSKIRQRRQELIRRQLNSELKALRSQLNPHFLFNSLNSIQNFINKSDAKTANLHLSKFSLLMRKIIELSEKESTTLKEELDFNTTYVDLERLRYGFDFNLDIDESLDLYNIEIPGMIIQPFVENAIVHSMSELGAKGELSIFVKAEGDDRIIIEISDNGKGIPADSRKGFGLKSSRERIDLLNSQNKEKIELYIESPVDTRAGTGTRIKLIIPKRY